MHKITISAACALLGLCTASAETYDAIWTGNAGDGKWGTAGNWEVTDSATRQVIANAVPNSTSTIDYRVRVNKTCSIEIDAGKTYKTYWFFPGGTAQVTLTGSGTLNNANWTFIDSGASMTVDGPTVTIVNMRSSETSNVNGTIYVKSGYLQTKGATGISAPDSKGRVTQATLFSGTGRVIVSGGRFGDTGNKICVTNAAEIIVTGGEMLCDSLYLRGNSDGMTGGTMRLLGGAFVAANTYSYSTSIDPLATFDFQGGTICWASGANQYAGMNFNGGSYGLSANHLCLLPPKGADLIIPTSSVNASGALRLGMACDYSIGGTVYVTNAITATNGNVVLPASVNVSGGGTIFANRLNFAPAANDKIVNFDLAALNLSTGGVYSSTSKSMKINFLNGITLGAWGGDWVMDEPNDRKVYVEGPLTIATTDALDATADDRAISAKGLYLANATELEVSGGGTVTLGARNCPARLHGIKVAAGGTLALTGAFGNLKAMNLDLGAGSTLKLDLSSGGNVDIAARATFGAGAKIVVTDVPATLTAGTQYPIFNLPPQKGDPASYPTIELPAEIASGWTVRWTANSAYLGDGGWTSPTTTPKNYATWTGAEDGVYTNVANWVNNSALAAGLSGSFKGTKNTILTKGTETDSWKARKLEFHSGAGAYVFRGDKLALSWPYVKGDSDTCSIESSSDRPVVIENDVTAHYQWVGSGDDKAKYYANKFAFQSSGEGSVSILGNSLMTLPLVMDGDIRFGGAWTAESLSACASSSLATRLTVLPNATVTVTTQTNEFAKAAYLAVAAGGSMSIAGTTFGFGAFPNTHFVDGSLTIGTPFVVATNETFRGSGTLTLAGGVSTTKTVTGEGIRLEGNLTLVPTGAWSAAVPLTVRDTVTVAPTTDWTLPAPLVIDDYASLTISAAGKRVELGAITTKGDLTMNGGTLALAGAMSVGSLTLANGANLALSGDLFTAAAAGAVDVLTTTTPIANLEIAKCKVTSRTDGLRTIYSAQRGQGLTILFR